MSHPVWVRGLKQPLLFQCRRNCVVAPRVGAWIETEINNIDSYFKTVAPRVGAWIETLSRIWI